MATEPAKPLKPLSPFFQTIAKSLWKEVEPQVDALFTALLEKIAKTYDVAVTKLHEYYAKIKAAIRTYIGIKTV